MGIAENPQQDGDQQGGDQDDDDRVFQIIEQLVPEGFNILTGHRVGTVLGTRRFDLLIG